MFEDNFGVIIESDWYLVSGVEFRDFVKCFINYRIVIIIKKIFGL